MDKSIIKDKFEALARSKFRSSFNLKQKDFEYIENKGIEKIREHAFDFVDKRLRKRLINDGRQTPMRGHPVFIAQHATATCCRGCISKWYNIPEDRELTDSEVDFIVEIIIEWIKSQY